VSTRAAAIGEFIEDGDNGLLVPPGAPEALAAALARMIAHPDLRQQFAHRAAETVRTRFSFDRRRRLDRLGAGPWTSCRQAKAAE
jgi:glycosyltransferase involved in cell wall biosynthesis